MENKIYPYKQMVMKCFSVHPDVHEDAKKRAAEVLGLGPRSFAKFLRALLRAWIDGKIDVELLRPYLGV